jgi:hypothetical protein
MKQILYLPALVVVDSRSGGRGMCCAHRKLPAWKMGYDGEGVPHLMELVRRDMSAAQLED